MVHGAFTTTPSGTRKRVVHPARPMSERESLALAHLIVLKKVEEARAGQDMAGGDAVRSTPKRRKRKKLTGVEVRVGGLFVWGCDGVLRGGRETRGEKLSPRHCNRSPLTQSQLFLSQTHITAQVSSPSPSPSHTTTILTQPHPPPATPHPSHQMLASLDKQEAALQEKLSVLEERKQEAFNQFKKV